jgi:hypothetical protein
MSTASTASASAASNDLTKPIVSIEQSSKPFFDMVFEICTSSVHEAKIGAPDLPIEQWEAAWEDLYQLHRKAEVGDGKGFHNRRYLIHSMVIKEYTFDYIIERTPYDCGWNCVIAVYNAETEESPYPYTEEWFPPQTIHELDEDMLISIPGQCYNCSVASQRICYECGIGICENCAPHSGMCPYCVMEHNEL